MYITIYFQRESHVFVYLTDGVMHDFGQQITITLPLIQLCRASQRGACSHGHSRILAGFSRCLPIARLSWELC